MGRMQLRANARDSGISTLLISSHCRKAGRQPDAFRRRPERKGNQTAQGGEKWEVKVVRGYLTSYFQRFCSEGSEYIASTQCGVSGHTF